LTCFYLQKSMPFCHIMRKTASKIPPFLFYALPDGCCAVPDACCAVIFGCVAVADEQCATVDGCFAAADGTCAAISALFARIYGLCATIYGLFATIFDFCAVIYGFFATIDALFALADEQLYTADGCCAAIMSVVALPDDYCGTIYGQLLCVYAVLFWIYGIIFSVYTLLFCTAGPWCTAIALLFEIGSLPVLVGSVLFPVNGRSGAVDCLCMVQITQPSLAAVLPAFKIDYRAMIGCLADATYRYRCAVYPVVAGVGMLLFFVDSQIANIGAQPCSASPDFRPPTFYF